jgi:hypothetical protein
VPNFRFFIKNTVFWVVMAREEPDISEEHMAFIFKVVGQNIFFLIERN